METVATGLVVGERMGGKELLANVTLDDMISPAHFAVYIEFT
jgi:hypothetical protein